MNSKVFNIISVLNHEIETLEACRKDKDDIEYQIVVRWLTSRIKSLER